MNAKSIRWPAAAVLAAVAFASHAQDPAKVAPDIYKCKLENDHARLCEVTFKPGAKIAPHSHPQHMVYVLAPGKLRITTVGGEPQEVEFAKGQTAWMPAETHFAENIGKTELKALVIEYRDIKE